MLSERYCHVFYQTDSQLKYIQVHFFSSGREKEAFFIQNKKRLVNISVEGLVSYFDRLKVYSSVFKHGFHAGF